MAQQIVDLGSRAQFVPSIVGASPSSGTLVGFPVDMKDADSYCNVWVVTTSCSGPFQIQVQTTDTLSGLLVSGGGVVSGAFTDPTSGLASVSVGTTFPTWFQSGAILTINSGLWPTIGGGMAQSAVSGFPLSGGVTQAYMGGFPQGTFPYGLTPTIQFMGGTAFVPNTPGISGVGAGIPRFNSGGMAVAGFQRVGQYARLLLLSGGTSTTVIAGFLSQLMGGGGGFSWSPGSGLSGGVGGTGFVGNGAIGMPLV
jgi:hypothetical protein